MRRNTDTPPLEIQQLVRDAHLLASYAMRNGKLPPHSRIFETVASLKGAAAADTSTVAQLCSEVDALAKAIAPMTLKQLLRRGSFIGHARHVVASVMPFAIGLMTLLLTLYLAFQSSQLYQANTAIREYQDWITQQTKEKLFAAWKMYRYERVLDLKAPPLAQLDAYQKLVEEVRQLIAKGAAIQTLLQDSASLLYFPHFLEQTGPEAFRELIKRLNGAPDIDQSLKQSDESGKQPADQADCERVPGVIVKVGLTKPTKEQADIDSYSRSLDCFLRRLKISEEQVAYSAWIVIYPTKSKINLLVGWLLPGLYGLLGACVYLMRGFVLERNGKSSHDITVLSMLSLPLRIALGGLAGIIIGWFWVPTPVTNENTLMPISSIPFGMAFLAGYSIDTLFSLLEGLNQSIEKSTGKKPLTG
jgi:hypothetical protein